MKSFINNHLEYFSGTDVSFSISFDLFFKVTDIFADLTHSKLY